MGPGSVLQSRANLLKDGRVAVPARKLQSSVRTRLFRYGSRPTGRVPARRIFPVSRVIPFLFPVCEPFIRQMTGGPAPSNLVGDPSSFRANRRAPRAASALTTPCSRQLSGRGNELLEEVYGKYNELKALLHSYEELLRKDDKAPLWATIPNYALQSAGESPPIERSR